jgi:uncharacterized membrane-anchored protein
VHFPGKEVSLIESMALCRGQLVFRQYIKDKRYKYGTELYILTEANGMILYVFVYTGQVDNLDSKGHGTNVIMKLMDGRLNFTIPR